MESRAGRSTTSILSASGTTTVPTSVQKALGLHPGDSVEFELREHEAVLRKAHEAQADWPAALSSTLTEWEDDLDDDL